MADETTTEMRDRRGASSESSEPVEPYDPEGLIGTTLAGRYEIERCIGKGGMGVVYLARQRALERKVVVKVLLGSFLDDEEAMGRFEREARGMSRLQHANIVAIYDFGRSEQRAYICMEWVAGETLSRRIKRDGPLSLEVFADIATQILRGIDEAHSLGLVHRDIKPSNIMLAPRRDEQCQVKILDFGLAKLVKGARDVTKEQSLVGSVSYLSPEQIMGNDVDQRVDIYALGILFFYMLTGKKPFEGDEDITVLYQHVHQAPPALGDHLPEGVGAPDALAGLIARMLAKDPDERPEDAGVVLSELRRLFLATSLEFAWPEGGGPGLIEGSDPSARIERNRFHTPTGQPVLETAPHAGVSNSPAEGAADPDSKGSFVTAEQIQQMQRQNARRTLLIALFTALLVAGGLVAYLGLFDSPEPVEEIEGSDTSSDHSAPQSPPEEEDRLAQEPEAPTETELAAEPKAAPGDTDGGEEASQQAESTAAPEEPEPAPSAPAQPPSRSATADDPGAESPPEPAAPSAKAPADESGGDEHLLPVADDESDGALLPIE
jgi:eukaryotic-like serine/threonine-protein kinase